ncbi:MAG TPA: AAA family ATPase [Symbiobacteriaceae bacterium]
MYLKQITLRNIMCFSEATLNFPPPGEAGNWCVVLGDNGTGKTTLLQAIALTLAGPGGLLNRPANWISQGADRAECEATFGLASGAERTTGYTIQNHRALLDETQAFQRQQPLTRDDLPDDFVLAGYGALRRMAAGDVPTTDTSVIDALVNLFDDTQAIFDPDALLRKLDHNAKDPKKNRRLRLVSRDLRDGMLAIADSLLPTDPPFRIKGVSSGGVSFLAPGGQEVPLAAVSEGHRNVFALAGNLIAFLWDQSFTPVDFKRAPDGSLFVDSPGIVLIDEVDLHLHPKWQRTIGKALQRVFPRIQFIVATHSPFVAQTANEGGLSVLRWENGTVKAESPLPSMHALPAEEILLGPAFGLETTRDPEIDALLREYVRLNALDLRGQLKAGDGKRLKELRKTLKGALPVDGNVYDTHTEVEFLVREAQKDND